MILNDHLTTDQVAVVVMAAGKGVRMNSDKPKVLHEIVGVPMIHRALTTINKLSPTQTLVVVGYKKQVVEASIKNGRFDCQFVDQGTPKGTGHALCCALKKVNSPVKYVLVLGGDDSAFYTKQTIKQFIASHIHTKATISMITMQMREPNRLGKVIRDDRGQFSKIMEAKDGDAAGITSDEVNCGAYIFNKDWLNENIKNIEPSSITGEYYITNLLNDGYDQHQVINLFNLADPNEWVGVNTPAELNRANLVMQQRKRVF